MALDAEDEAGEAADVPREQSPLGKLAQYFGGFGIEFMVAVFLGWGVEAAFSYASQPNPADRLRAFCVLWFGSGAAFFAGTIMGFIFGFPKTRAKNRSEDDAQNRYGDNTNLEEVSDWLTKIIVGITLVQFKTILDGINSIAENLGRDLGNVHGAVAVSLCSIIYGFICGFLYYYIWARIKLYDEFLSRARK